MGASRITLQERNPVVLGVIGLAIAVLLVTAGLNVNSIRSLFGETTFGAQLSDAGGARSGDPVRVDGLTVGSISSVAIEGKAVLIKFRAGGVRLGNKTRVEVKSDNALGSKYLSVEPGGTGSASIIPIERTDPGYAVSEVLGRLTSNNSKIDVAQMDKSFKSLTKVLDASPEEFGSALTGVSALSKTIRSRDTELATLLQKASSVSGVLAKRNEEITSMMGDGSRLFQEIYARREAISRLFAQVGRAADQIVGLTDDNRTSLKPRLIEINHFAKILADYRDSLDYTLQTFPKYVRSLGEGVGSGPFFNAYVANLLAPESLASTDNVIKDLLGSNPSEQQ